jgi:hypothetical protein
VSRFARYLRLLIAAAACSFFLYNAVRSPGQRVLSIVFAVFSAIWLIGLLASLRPKRTPFPVDGGRSPR